MSLYLVRVEITTANAWGTDQPGKDLVKADEVTQPEEVPWRLIANICAGALIGFSCT